MRAAARTGNVSGRAALVWVMLALAATALVWLLGRVLVAGGALARVDRAVLVTVNGWRVPGSLEIAEVIAWVIGPEGAPAVGLVLILGFAWRRRSGWMGLRAAVILVVSWGVTQSLKFAVGRPRPEASWLAFHPLPTPSTPSFPSGHTAFAAAACMAMLLSMRAGPRRRIVGVCSVVAVVIVAWSRLAVGAHFGADTLASALLAPVLALATAHVLDLLHARFR